ncbi:MAG: histidine triad nucleotide-binding protein [Pseudomonadota bacterium]|nr:histidine triad nucleotide-binding protein [Pseudomonadota bacterium]
MDIVRDPDCLFCKIVAGEVPSKRIYENEEILVFHDISPQAPFHALIIPKNHISTVNDFPEEQKNLAGNLFLTAKLVARDQGFSADGYRLVLNTNKEGGQVIFHVHMHLLAGRQLIWPPG